MDNVKFKGMSKLQRFILGLAEKQGGQVLARDVLIQYYGLKPVNTILGPLPRPGSQVFNRASIGLAIYCARTVAVCKAFNRLACRGFAERIEGGVRCLNSTNG